MDTSDFVYQIKLGTLTDVDLNKGVMVTEPTDVQTFLRNIGYTDATLVDYSLSKVIDMVSNKQLPVYVAGYPLSTQENGHAWVIDGCNVYTVDYWVRHYSDSLHFTEYIESTQNYNFVHCNFGWDGQYDGDFTSGLFDTPRGNYSYRLKLITYSLN